MRTVLLKKEYSAESLLDAEQDIQESLANDIIPVDDSGFAQGTFTITVEWSSGEEDHSDRPPLLTDAVAEIERLRAALVAITDVPPDTVLTAHRMRLIAKNAIAT